MKARPECVLVLAFHEHPEQPYERWFPGQRFVFVTSREQRASFASCSSEVRVLTNYDDHEELLACVRELAQGNHITHVFARAERDVLRAAALRELLGCAGLDMDESLPFRDKHLMYRRIEAAGVPLPPFQAVTSMTETRAFLRSHGRIVLKPAYGSGSLGVEVIAQPTDLAAYLMGYRGEPLLAQAFAEGDMYHVDGVWDGRALGPTFVSKYVNTCMSFRAEGYLGSYLVGDPARRQALSAFAEQALGALGVGQPLVFHLEVFVHGDHLRFCEIACRPGGTRVIKTLENHSGVNLDRALAGLLLEQAPLPHASAAVPSGWLVIPPRPGRVAAMELIRGEPWIKEMRVAGHPGTQLGRAKKSGDYLVTYVLEGDSEEEVRRRLVALGDTVSASIVMEGT